MALRRAPILVALAIAAACGGSPVAPVLPTSFVLDAGSYTLNIYPATAPPAGPVACVSSNGGAGSTIAIPVEVQRDGPLWVARPAAGTLRLQLVEVAPSAYYGPLDGAFTLGAVTVTAGSSGEPAIVTGFAFGAPHLSGRVDGPVIFRSGSAQTSCTPNDWSLIRR